MRLCQKQSRSREKKSAQFAPKIVQIQINPDKIGDVVGQRGKTINEIIDAHRR